jgi:hypothetical protein
VLLTFWWKVIDVYTGDLMGVTVLGRCVCTNVECFSWKYDVRTWSKGGVFVCVASANIINVFYIGLLIYVDSIVIL